MDNGNGSSLNSGDDVDSSVVWFWVDKIKDGHCLVLSVILGSPCVLGAQMLVARPLPVCHSLRMLFVL